MSYVDENSNINTFINMVKYVQSTLAKNDFFDLSNLVRKMKTSTHTLFSI